MTRKYRSVWEYFTHSHVVRPMTSKELLLTIEKSQGTIHKELKNLMKHGLLERIEVDVIDQTVTFYRKKKDNGNED